MVIKIIFDIVYILESTGSHKLLKVTHEELSTTKREGGATGEANDYDYEDAKETEGTIADPRRAGGPETGRVIPAQHSEVKKKRAHNIITHESPARTLIPSSNHVASSVTLESPIVSFRSTVQHRLSAFVTWPERLEPCSSYEPVAGYIIRYKAFNDLAEYVVRDTVTNFVLLENLLPNVRYKYSVKYVLEQGGATAWSQEGSLDTSYYQTGT